MNFRHIFRVVWSIILLLLGSILTWAQTNGQTAPAPPRFGWMDVFKGFVGFGFGLLAFWLQQLFTRERRSLSANISTFSLLSLPETIRGQIQVKFQDQLVENILSNRVTFLNTGNKVVQNHEIRIAISAGSTILHIDPGQRFEMIDSTDNHARLKLSFLNPRRSTDLRITTTGGGEQNLTIEGEGPGIQFNTGERILPVLDPNMTIEELRKLMQRATWGRMKKQLPWTIPTYIVLLFLMFFLLYWFEI